VIAEEWVKVCEDGCKPLEGALVMELEGHKGDDWAIALVFYPVYRWVAPWSLPMLSKEFKVAKVDFNHYILSKNRLKLFLIRIMLSYKKLEVIT
jgi:hypothetical protein